MIKESRGYTNGRMIFSELIEFVEDVGNVVIKNTREVNRCNDVLFFSREKMSWLFESGNVIAEYTHLMWLNCFYWVNLGG